MENHKPFIKYVPNLLTVFRLRCWCRCFMLCFGGRVFFCRTAFWHAWCL